MTVLQLQVWKMSKKWHSTFLIKYTKARAYVFVQLVERERKELTEGNIDGDKFERHVQHVHVCI